MKEIHIKIISIFFIALMISIVPAASLQATNTSVFENESNKDTENIEKHITCKGNQSNSTLKNKSTKRLITDLQKKMGELNRIGKSLDSTTVVKYSNQELKKLRTEVEQLNTSAGVKKSLLNKLDIASKLNDKASQLILQGNPLKANILLKTEKNILKAFENEIKHQKGKKITTEDAEKLIQHTDKIINGIEGGSQWILKENPEFEFKPDSNTINSMQSKLNEIQGIVAELQSRGAKVDVKIVDVNDLNKYSIDKIKENGTKEVRAFAPVIAIVIEVGGELVVIAIEAAVAGSILATVKIGLIEEYEGHVCLECKTKIYEFEILSAIISGGIGTALEITFIKYGLGSLTKKELLALILAESAIDQIVGKIVDEYQKTCIGSSCDDPTCVFYTGADLLFEKMDVPDQARMGNDYQINATVANRGKGNAKSFLVALYVNSTPADTPENRLSANYTILETKVVSSLDSNKSTDVQFNWKPTYTGKNFLKVVVDPINQIRESREDNNEIGAEVNVLLSQLVKCTLYKKEEVPSSSDPNQPNSVTYYYKAERPVLLSPGSRTPTFIYNTSDPVYSPVGFQAWYPYGAIWQYYGDAEEGPFDTCFYNPYVVCDAGITNYRVDHWAMGSGYHQYFAVRMKTQPVWSSGIIKTELNELWLYDKSA